MADFDLSIYYPIPLLTTEGYVSLSNTLLDINLSDPPPQVVTARSDLKEVNAEAEGGLVARIDEDLSTGREQAFDVFVDRVWVELRERFEFYSIYHHEGAAMLNEEDRQVLDFEERLEQARAAGQLLERMFGTGNDFLRAVYPQQATHMAARLDWVASKDLDETLETLVGQDLANLVKRCQIRYEAMVSERSSRDGKSSADVRELRQRLRRQLYAYCGAIGTMYDYKKPESAKAVEAALRPILVMRAQARRTPSAAGEAEPVTDNEAPEPTEPLDGGVEAETSVDEA